jgi:hypothetical protein
VDILTPPASITLATPAAYSPTFVPIDDGMEAGRITGYPGKTFFWGFLAYIFRKLATK